LEDNASVKRIHVTPILVSLIVVSYCSANPTVLASTTVIETFGCNAVEYRLTLTPGMAWGVTIACKEYCDESPVNVLSSMAVTARLTAFVQFVGVNTA
jgi:hypothetical protein